MKRGEVDQGWEVPPEGAQTYLGVHGITNEMTLWLLRKHSELLAESPRYFTHGRLNPPWCLRCYSPRRRMHWRPAKLSEDRATGNRVMAEFVCYMHDPPLRREIRPKFERAPRGDVLGRTGEMLDCERDPQTGKLEIVSMEVKDAAKKKRKKPRSARGVGSKE